MGISAWAEYDLKMLVGNGLDFNDEIRVKSHLNGYVFRHQNVVPCCRLIGPYF